MCFLIILDEVQILQPLTQHSSHFELANYINSYIIEKEL
jgi:hypothetical protein